MSAANMELVVSAIAEAELVDLGPLAGRPVDMQELFEEVERRRLATVDSLLKKYRTIKEQMGKVEGLVGGSGTHRSPALAGYYAHFEARIFRALTTCIYRALRALGGFLNLWRPPGKPRHPPIFRVSASLSVPDIVLSPPLTEIHRMLNKLVRPPPPFPHTLSASFRHPSPRSTACSTRWASACVWGGDGGMRGAWRCWVVRSAPLSKIHRIQPPPHTHPNPPFPLSHCK